MELEFADRASEWRLFYLAWSHPSTNIYRLADYNEDGTVNLRDVAQLERETK